MLKSKRIKLIQQLADKKQDTAILEFGSCMNKLQAMENQLKKLYQYRKDYNNQFNQTAAGGLKSSSAQSFLKFINTLSHNIDSLLKAIEMQRKQCEQLKQIWLQTRREVQILDKVEERYIEQETIEENKKEQSLTDESSQAFYFRKLS
jgi:flagellar FliJ protein